jgi:hypothetical protein
MLAKVMSSAVLGIDAYPVEVEVDIASRGLCSSRRWACRTRR